MNVLDVVLVPKKQEFPQPFMMWSICMVPLSPGEWQKEHTVYGPDKPYFTSPWSPPSVPAARAKFCSDFSKEGV